MLLYMCRSLIESVVMIQNSYNFMEKSVWVFVKTIFHIAYGEIGDDEYNIIHCDEGGHFML